jgi:O-antigen/teichoic acid export membrane protein
MNMALPFFVALPEDTADLVQVYTLIPFLNILFSYGMETAYFRFSQQEDKQKLYNTLSISLLTSTLLFSGLLWIFKSSIVSATDLDRHSNYIQWMIAIIAIDNLNTLPFARLRQENRPRKYALARISGIMVNVLMVFFFLAILPGLTAHNPDRWYTSFYDPAMGVGYYLVGNVLGSLFTLFILGSEFRKIRFEFDFSLWKKVMTYSAPLILVGLGGMVNDVMSRLIYRHVVNLPQQQADHELGVFANIFRLALLITILIQAFRMAAEPFFFNQSKKEDAPKTYARVMKFFVIACCFLFLGIGLFLDIFRWIFSTFASAQWTEGLEVVPLLALGNIFLGIYYNLSIWYKLTNKNHIGAYITVIGAIITFLLNYWLIPVWHYAGAAFATFSCYLFMMIASYRIGKKYYPVPYATKKLSAYIILVLLIYGFHRGLMFFLPDQIWISLLIGALLFLLFTRFVIRIEKRELIQFSFSKWLYKH